MMPEYNKKLIEEFKRTRLASHTTVTEEKPKKKKPTHIPPKSKRKSNSSPYNTFLDKMDNLEETIDSFSTRDLVYYFREISERNNYKYVVTNIKKDMAIMKRLQENYTQREICGMIEFLYESEQDYLDKTRISPNLLSSQWVNTIYADTMLWIEDNYVPKKKQKHKAREWTSTIEEDTSEIGAWE